MHPLAVPQPSEIGVGEANRDMGRLAVVAAAEHFAAGINPGQCLAVGEWHIDAHRACGAPAPLRLRRLFCADCGYSPDCDRTVGVGPYEPFAGVTSVKVV